MAKKEKKEGLTLEDAQKNLEAAITARKTAREAVVAFEKKNGLAPMQKHGDNEKFGKDWKKLRKVWVEAKEVEATATAAVKELKPSKPRESGKYAYPEDCVTTEDKKKFRAAARAAAKKSEKGEAPTKSKKADKEEKVAKKDKTKKEEAPAEESAPKKGDKDKKKKKKAAASKED